jgi:26S proteasome regulatory subunit N2
MRYYLSSESLYESEELPQDARDAAALLASKVYYYLGEYDEALSFALNAGSAFEHEGVTPGAEEYVETVICEPISVWKMQRSVLMPYVTCVAKALDRYVEARGKAKVPTDIDNKLQGIIEGIFRRCIRDGEYKQVCILLRPRECERDCSANHSTSHF